MAASEYFGIVQQLYVSYFGRPADTYGLQAFAERMDAAGAPKTLTELNEAAQAAPNSAVGQLVSSFNNAQESIDLYGTGTSQIEISKFVNAIYKNILGRDADTEGGTFWINAIVNGNLTKANAALAITLGALGNTTPQGLLDAQTVTNKTTVATTFTDSLDTIPEINAYSGNAAAAVGRDLLTPVTSTTDLTAYNANINAAIGQITAPPVVTTALTESTDNVLGGAGNDVFTGTGKTFTALDKIDGGAGTNMLTVLDPNGSFTAGLPAGSSIKNIQVFNVTTSAGISNTGAYDTTGITGLTTLNATTAGVVNVKVADIVNSTITNTTNDAVTVVGGKSATITTGTGAVTVSGNAGGLTAVSVTGGSNVAITTAAVTGAVDVLTNVSLSGNTGATATIQSDALTSLSLTNTAVGATVSAAAATRALTVNVDGVTGGAVITDAEATSLTLNATGAASTVALSADKATTLAVTGAKAVSVSLASAAALTAIDASASAGLTLTSALASGVAFTGGAGADTITVGASTKAIVLGAGDDVVNLSVAALTGTIAGGAGTDTLALSAANAVTASGSTTLATKVTGFEVLSLGAVGAGSVVDLAALNNGGANTITKVIVAGATAALTINGVTANNTVEFTGTATGQTTTATLLDNTGTADVFNVSVKNVAGISAGTVAAAGVETVKFMTDDTATTATGIQHTATLTDAAAKAITVTGDAGLALTFTGTALTSFDASGVTKGAVSWTSADLAAAATITGGADANTFNLSATTKAITVTGGAAVDTITTGAGVAVVNTGAGADVITLGAGAATVNAGAGNDIINLGTGLSVVTGGAGTDAFSLAGVVVTNGNTYSTITDFTVGETIAFTDAGAYAGSATLGAKLALAGTAAFADFLGAAAAGTTAGEIKWFQFGGDTYVVNDADAGAAFVNGVDQIVKLTGLVDLSASTTSAAGIVTYVAA
nr:DUF4214 domain-containing protein [uncultured Duganella sp.]